MGRPRIHPLNPFGEVLHNTLKSKTISPTSLAIASGLSKQTISNMCVVGSFKLTRNNVLQCLKGLIDLDAIEEKDDANYLLEVAEFETLNAGNGRDRDVIKLLKQIQEQVRAEHEHAFEKPKYTTFTGIPIIGRDEDILNVLDILKDKDNHLLFLVGLPGVGKSELARQVREEAKSQGIFTSTLDPISLVQGTTPDAIITSLTLRLKRIPKQVKTLLTLEDCEQVEPVKELIRALRNFLDNHKHISILATSRKQMTENDYPVPTLEPPKRIDESPETLLENDAVRLFLESANANKKPNDEELTIAPNNAKTVASLCIALDGIPLMLRLAASMVRKLKGVEGVYSWLREGKLQGVKNLIVGDEEWHVSINTVIDRSYQLLKPDERALFRRLAVFVGMCNIEATINVCNLEDELSTEIDSFTTIVNALSDLFLITFDDELIAIAHNTIHDFALRKLAQSKEGEEMTDRYIDYYDTLVTQYMVLRYMQEKDEKFPKEALAKYLDLLRGEVINLANVYNLTRMMTIKYIRIMLTSLFGVQKFQEFSKILIEDIQKDNDEWTEELEKIDPFIQAIRELRAETAVPPNSWKIWEDFRRFHGSEFIPDIIDSVWPSEDFKVLADWLFLPSTW